jgi:carboxyl-terminal processing protease
MAVSFPSMSRERFAWLVSVILLAILAFDLPGTMGQRDDDTAWISTLLQVHRKVQDDYVEPVNDDDLKTKAIQGMLGNLDPFTQYIPPSNLDNFNRQIDGTFKGVGISLDGRDKKVTVVTPIENSPADKAGVHAGDVIIKVDGQSIDGLALDEVSKKILGPIGTPVTLTMLRDGQQIDFTMNRAQIVMPTVLGFERNPDDSWKYFVNDNPKIAYVRITQFDENTFNDFHSVLEEAVHIINMFVNKDSVIVTTRGRNRPEEIRKATGEGQLPNFPMIVLVNDNSASASEIVSGSLKDNNRAEIIGQRTYGKGSVQELIPLDGGGELKLTVAHYFLPSGRLVQRLPDAKDWGVEPQIIVPMDDSAEAALTDTFESRTVIRRSHPLTPSTRPTTRPIDPQFDTALRTMIGTMVLNKTALPAATGP